MAAPNARPPARNIAEFGLVRKVDDPEVFSSDFLDYLQNYLGACKLDDWQFYDVERMVSSATWHKLEGVEDSDFDDSDMEDSGNSDDEDMKDVYNDDDNEDEQEDPEDDPDDYYLSVFILHYATWLAKQTYQIMSAKLVNDPKEDGSPGDRRTDMRLHEMIRSTWAMEAVATNTELASIAVHHIINEKAREAIENEFEAAIGRGADPTVLECKISGRDVPLSPYWRDNPFIGVCVGVAGAVEKVREVNFVRAAADNKPETFYHMFVRLDT